MRRLWYFCGKILAGNRTSARRLKEAQYSRKIDILGFSISETLSGSRGRVVINVRIGIPDGIVFIDKLSGKVPETSFVSYFGSKISAKIESSSVNLMIRYNIIISRAFKRFIPENKFPSKP